MAKTAADVLIEGLIDWGVDTVYGIPGDGINGIMEALRTHQKQVRFVQVRHEEAAAFMACAHAKYTGKLGVCLATSGPGGIHLLNGLYDAKLDGVPVLAITGHHFHDLIGTHAQQDVDLDRLFIDVAVYSQRVMGPAHVEALTDIAVRSALGYRGVAHINFPVDFQDMPMSKKHASARNRPHHSSDVLPHSARLPSDQDLKQAADILNRGERVAILAGQGAKGAGAELVEVAELLGAPIVKALLGKQVVPDKSPYTTGGIGLLGTRPSEDAMENCDTILIVGSSFPYMEFMPKPGQARGVQIEIDPQRISLRYPVEVGLLGDAKLTLRALIPLLERKSNRKFLEKAQSGMKDWWKLMDERAHRTDSPMKPQVVAHELGKRLPADAIISCDSGTITTWAARQIPIQEGQMFTLSGTLATMSCCLPYTNAAQIAFPDRTCIGIVGDGGFTMLMCELITAVKYKLPVKILVFKNDCLGQIKWEQNVMLGNPQYGCDLQPIDFAKYAEAVGAAGFTIEKAEDCGEILDRALATPGPVVIEAIVDPYEPPMPGKVKFEQAKEFATALARGEKDAREIIATVGKDKIKELV